MQVFSLEEAGGQSKLAEENHPAQRDSLTKCNCDDDNGADSLEISSVHDANSDILMKNSQFKFVLHLVALKYFAFFGSFCHMFPISHGGVKSFGICCWINLNSLMDSSSQVAQLFSTDDQLVSIKTF